MANLDWSKCPVVESVPGRLNGAWVFRDTRMPVSAIFENLQAGASIEEIIEQFDVTREQINAVLEFAARSLDGPAAFLAGLARLTHGAEHLGVEHGRELVHLRLEVSFLLLGGGRVPVGAAQGPPRTHGRAPELVGICLSAFGRAAWVRSSPCAGGGVCARRRW